ncbi:MAG: SAF domain-containing protein [Acidimicrobiaceae bacterium]|nr:SAF domain-containing protein [Acidimicrobiaceae bacterium]
MSSTEKKDRYPDESVNNTKILTPRRGLPSGRAVIGALFVTLSAVGAFTLARHNDGVPDTYYLVASRAVEAGEMVGLDDVTFLPMMLPYEVAANAVSSIVGVDGAVATRDLLAGDVVTTRDLIAATNIDGVAVAAIHELSLPVARDRIVDRIVAGDLVTVLITLRHENDAITVVGVEDAITLKWSTENNASGSGTLTLALDNAVTAMSLTHLVQQGDVTVVRTTRAATQTYPDYLSTADILVNSDLESVAGE